MAEVKKKFSQLDPGSVPFDGTETIAAVQGGITKRGTISGIHGAGWWDKLKSAFVDFVAPEALHANDADTIGGETSVELHNAGALIGTAPLSVIPAQLTGKNAATATSAAKLTNARTITLTGNATGSTSFDGSGNVSISVTVGYATSAGSAGYATNAGTSGACSGNAATATKLRTARTITISGDATGSTTFDGSANKTITLDVTYATNATNATNADYASLAGRIPNGVGSALPTADATRRGDILYNTSQGGGLYYCAATSASPATYQWIKISG